MLRHACYAVALCAAALAGNTMSQAAATLAPRSYFSDERLPQLPTDPVMADAAHFAVDQLRALSDSGIYSTLSLAKIHEAATELGDFHYVIHLRVALASPYFRSKQAEEDFELMVLESKPRGESQNKGPSAANATRSLAIDEFPVMDEDAIEDFWVDMVETRRRRRWELFAQWEREELELEQQKNEQQALHEPSRVTNDQVEPQHKSEGQEQQPVKTRTLTLDELHAMPAKQLRELLATPESTAQLRSAIEVILDDRLALLEQREQGLQATLFTTQRDEL